MMKTPDTYSTEPESGSGEAGTYYGWIPCLDEDYKPQILPKVAMREPERKRTYGWTTKSIITDGIVLVDGNPEKETKIVHITGDLLYFDADSGIQAADIYLTAKANFHRDFNHEWGMGLRCVKADTPEEAYDKIALQFVEWVDTEASDNGNRHFIKSDTVMNRIGIIEYGLSYLSRNEKNISEPVYVTTHELLTAGKTFLEMRANHQNAELATDLASKVEWLTWIIVALTVFTALMAVYEYLLPMTDFDNVIVRTLLTIVACIPLVVSIVWYRLKISEMKREKDEY